MTTAALFLALLVTPGAEGEQRPQILDFHAEWCGPCKAMQPRVQALIRRGYPVKSIDFDDHPELVQKYRVSGIPTFIVVDPRGRELARTSGYQEESALAALYDEAAAKLDASTDEPPARKKAGPVERDDEGPTAAGEKRPRPWETVVRIKIHNPPRSIGFGSGTIIHSDEDEAIILTCAHIFHIEGRREQPHPKRFPLKIEVDLFDGKIRSLRPAQVRPIATVAGEAIDYDFAADVGLIRIRTGRKLPASPVVPASWKPRKGLPMVTVGCSQGKDATAWSTRIAAVQTNLIDGRQHHAIICEHAPIIGRSGGGLYTEDGYVVGVCDFADRQNNVGLYASPTSIHKLLDRNRLTALYAPAKDRPGPMLAASGSRGGEATKLRTQSPSPRESGGRPITLPDPTLVGIRVPDPDASEMAGPAEVAAPWRAKGGGEAGVRKVAEGRPRGGLVRAVPDRREDVRRPAVNPEDFPARAEAMPTDLKMDPSAADPLDSADEPEEARPEPRISPRAPADAWRAARRSRPAMAGVNP